MSFPQEEKAMIMLPKDGESIGNNDGVLEGALSTSFVMRLGSYLVDEMTM
jgi:hypothetical protein